MNQADHSLESSALEILADLGTFSATSYWEDEATSYLAGRAESAGLDVNIDQWGNVLVSKQGTDPGAPGIAFVAHTDHPGYEVVEQSGRKLTLAALGGVGKHAGAAGTKVVVVNSEDSPISATVTGAEPPADDYSQSREDDGWLGTRTVYAELDSDVDLGDLPLPVVPDLPDFEIRDGIIYMRAADDLAGCAAILGALENLGDTTTQGSVYGLFTRAEEVGLLGAALAAEDELLPKSTVIVSVETSSVLPGAEIGNGVVIRTGDRAATFDYEAEAYLAQAAQNIRSVDNTYKVQRQLMSAGGCEASAFKAFGYSVTGTAFPLGAWHNRGENGVEPEFISKDDFVGGTRLIAGAAKLAGTAPAGILARFADSHAEQGERLRNAKT